MRVAGRAGHQIYDVESRENLGAEGGVEIRWAEKPTVGWGMVFQTQAKIRGADHGQDRTAFRAQSAVMTGWVSPCSIITQRCQGRTLPKTIS